MPATKYLSMAVQYLLWPFRQLVGGLRNAAGFVMSTSWTAWLVPALASSIRWIVAQVPLAFGFGSPAQQITASAALAVASYLTGYVTAGAAWALIAVFAATAGIGIVRFVPVVNQYWPLRRVSGVVPA